MDCSMEKSHWQPSHLVGQPPMTESDFSATDPLTVKFGASRELSTKDKMLAVLDEVEIIYETLMSVLGSQPVIALDPTASSYLTAAKVPLPSEGSVPMEADEFERTVTELVEFLVERQLDFSNLSVSAQKEMEIETAIQALGVESNKLKDQVMALQSRLKEAEQVLASALHMARQKTETIKYADDAQLTLDEIIRYAHRISVGFSASAPANWAPGDPRRPYPTDLEMRAGALARLVDVFPPPNIIPSFPTETLTATSRDYLASNAGPYTMSSQPLSQAAVDSPKTTRTTSLHREASADAPDVDLMTSDDSTTSSSDDE